MKNLTRSVLAILGLGFVLSVGAQAPDIRQGLVAYWPLESHDGSTTPDVAFINPMSLVGTPTADPGQVGNAFTFNGISTYLINNHAADNATTGLPIYRAGSYTITMWVKGPAQTAKYLFTEGNTADNDTLLILQTGQAAANNAKFDVIIRTDAGTALINHVVSSNVVFDNTWHHIAWVDDRGSARLYVDGNLDQANFNYTPGGTLTFTTTVIGNLVRIAIAGAYFNGQIDDVAVWERPLTQSEVQQVRTSSITTPIPNLPPFILTQPVSATRMIGDHITLSVRAVAGAGRPLSYQWRKGVVDVPGGTGSSLFLNHVSPSDAGDYSVRVTAGNGLSVDSSNATLVVVPDAAPDLRAGLVSHWPLDVENAGDTGLTTPDLYSHNDMREVAAGFLTTPGMVSNGLAFNGVDQYAIRSGGFPIYSNPGYSIAMWVKAVGTGQSDRRFFSESSTNSNNPLFNLGSETTGLNGTIRVYIRNSAGTVLLAQLSSRTALDGTWHHVVWTETNGFGRLYIDGVQDENDFIYTRSALLLDQTTLGAIVRNNLIGNHLACSLDEVAVWNRVLNVTEIQALFSGGVPPPIGVIPPTITQQPASLALLTKSTAYFSFQATGTGPLHQQWRKDGEELVDQTNVTLVLNNLTLGDAGNYDVVVTNTAASATSTVATLTVGLRPPSPTVLRVDINNTGGDDIPANTETGFSSYSIPMIGTGPFTRTIAGADLTLTAVGTTMESRKRLQPTNTVSFTEERLLQDFVFTRDTTVNQGLDVAVEFMEPNTLYHVAIWSYDNTSVTLDRISDWTANGVPVRTGYSFFGSNLPIDNNTYRFDFDTVSDAQGKVLIQARRSANAGGDLNCFLNAITLEKRYLRVVSLDNFMNLDMTLVFEALNPGAAHRVQARTFLGSGTWADVPDAIFIPLGGNLIQASFSAPFPATATQFYQVVQEP